MNGYFMKYFEKRDNNTKLSSAPVVRDNKVKSKWVLKEKVLKVTNVEGGMEPQELTGY